MTNWCVYFRSEPVKHSLMESTPLACFNVGINVGKTADLESLWISDQKLRVARNIWSSDGGASWSNASISPSISFASSNKLLILHIRILPRVSHLSPLTERSQWMTLTIGLSSLLPPPACMQHVTVPYLASWENWHDKHTDFSDERPMKCSAFPDDCLWTARSRTRLKQ